MGSIRVRRSLAACRALLFCDDQWRPSRIGREGETDGFGAHPGLRHWDGGPLMNPLISDGAINAGKHGDFEQHSAEAFDQRPQAGFWHRWYKFVEHGSLTKQRMRALF